MDVVTSSAQPPVKLLLLLLALSPAAASKVIAKGGKKRVQPQADGGGGTFRCRTCGRRFATFQALGGHRTSHKRRPRVFAHGIDLLLGARPGKGEHARPVQHRCGTCGKAFATGQALGGHMRRHRPAAGGATSSSGLSAGQHDDDENDAWPTLIQFI